jgi:type I restriction-modification system DNA methylase subunit
MHEPGCYYTQEQVSALLIAQIEQVQPQSILDLGAGHGALVKAAKNRWPSSVIHAAELNIHGHSFLRMRFPDVRAIRINGLDLQLDARMNIEPGSIDVAVCNPPYLHFKNTREYEGVFRAAGLEKCMKLHSLTTDVLFLAQNLRLLRHGGELGIIVPDGLLTGKGFLLLREELITNHQVFGIIQLPEKVFPNTEARTHILLVRRNGETASNVPVHMADYNGKIVSSITVPSTSLIERMDFQFWNWKQKYSVLNNSLTLKEIGAEIKRGSFSLKQCEKLQLNYFHTTHFSNKTLPAVKLQTSEATLSGVIAVKGDILLARVGKTTNNE